MSRVKIELFKFFSLYNLLHCLKEQKKVKDVIIHLLPLLTNDGIKQITLLCNSNVKNASKYIFKSFYLTKIKK